MIVLLPRLPAPAAERLIDHMLGPDGFRWGGFAPETLPEGARYAATGGTTITAQRLRDLRSGLADLARLYGFGGEVQRDDHAGFDAALGGWLAGFGEFNSGEALRDDVWTFLTVVMAPDIVHWRFGTSRERYLGGVRNTFQRSWLRARVLDRGPRHPERWALLEQLSEDALVQITERPAIGADPKLARELAEGWVRAADRIGRNRMEGVMRLATLRLRIRNEIQALAFLSEDVIAVTIDEFFDRAASAIVPGRNTAEHGAPAGITQSGHPFRQATASSGVDADDGDASLLASTTRRRSWAIWRAR